MVLANDINISTSILCLSFNVFNINIEFETIENGIYTNKDTMLIAKVEKTS